MPGPAAVFARLRDRSRALGALSAQFSQAAGSLLIGVLSARLMERIDFATISLILSEVVVATGISTGLVGDTLTVLDRHDEQIRTALRQVLGGLLVAAAVVATGASVLTRQLDWGPAALFGVLLAAWLAEDVIRRLLMASLRFWPIVAVDLTHLVVSSSTVLVAYLAGGRHPTVGLFLVALTAGQVAAGLVGVVLLPASERYWGHRRSGGLHAVLDFGVSRSVQGSLRPVVLLALRIVVIFVAGKAVYATLEAARLYVAPALLAVNGVGSFLLSTFASTKGALPRKALRRADLAATALLACSAVFTVISGALAIWAPTLLSAKVPVTALPVVAWGVYTGCVAVTMPYGSLAAVRGSQHRVLLIRLADSTASLLILCVGLLALSVSVELAPALVGLGSLLGAVLLRPLAASSVIMRAKHVGEPGSGRPPARRVRDPRSRPAATAWVDADDGRSDRLAAPTGSLLRFGLAPGPAAPGPAAPGPAAPGPAAPGPAAPLAVVPAPVAEPVPDVPRAGEAADAEPDRPAAARPGTPRIGEQRGPGRGPASVRGGRS